MFGSIWSKPFPSWHVSWSATGGGGVKINVDRRENENVIVKLNWQEESGVKGWHLELLHAGNWVGSKLRTYVLNVHFGGCWTSNVNSFSPSSCSIACTIAFYPFFLFLLSVWRSQSLSQSFDYFFQGVCPQCSLSYGLWVALHPQLTSCWLTQF